jgi:hypothetical protein
MFVLILSHTESRSCLPRGCQNNSLSPVGIFRKLTCKDGNGLGVGGHVENSLFLGMIMRDAVGTSITVQHLRPIFRSLDGVVFVTHYLSPILPQSFNSVFSLCQPTLSASPGWSTLFKGTVSPDTVFLVGFSKIKPVLHDRSLMVFPEILNNLFETASRKKHTNFFILIFLKVLVQPQKCF